MAAWMYLAAESSTSTLCAYTSGCGLGCGLLGSWMLAELRLGGEWPDAFDLFRLCVVCHAALFVAAFCLDAGAAVSVPLLRLLLDAALVVGCGHLLVARNSYHSGSEFSEIGSGRGGQEAGVKMQVRFV